MAGVYLAVVIGLLVYALNFRPPNDGDCPANSSASGASLPEGESSATLELAEGQRSELRFGRSQDRRERLISFKVSGTPRTLTVLPEGAQLRTEIGPFLRTNDDETLNLNATAGQSPLISAVAVRQRGLVLLTLCADRDGTLGELGPPGSYTGTVSIYDPRVTPVDIPFTITMAFPAWPWVLLLLACVLPPAAAYAWLLKGIDASVEQVNVGMFARWLISRLGVLAVGSGSVAAFIAFSATYLQSDTWGSNVIQVTALSGAMFTAFVTAATAILAGSVPGSQQRGDASLRAHAGQQQPQ